ncbi:molybdopterin synthase sulfur carrier subunit [Amycolatopsis sp. WAC 04182]|nr:molybdopterin synthase sulfur carrier subunit [Amycolatopsis sp. WAC 04182]
MTIVVRYFASARAATGLDEEKVTLPDGARVADAVSRLRELHPEKLAKLLDAVSYLLDGVAVRDLTRPLTEGAELDVLPPFAGG